MARDSVPLNGLFNRTMSYRLDSDYPCPYGFLTELKKPLSTEELFSIIPNHKNATVSWMVSHCATVSRREILVRELQKYINVDIYGTCGPNYCDRTAEEGCYKMLGEQYKVSFIISYITHRSNAVTGSLQGAKKSMFYLSFENSLCKDYITEKFSNALRFGMVPVVFGGGDYSQIVPFPKSYIQVKDFPNIEELAKYLNYLDKNESAYMEYFEWRRYYRIHIRQGFMGFRRMCFAIQFGDQKRHKIYHNVKKWYVDQGNCSTPSCRGMSKDFVQKKGMFFYRKS